MMSRLFSRLLRQSEGNATVELALVSPVLLTMALGGIDLAMGFAHKMQMQHYAQVGADYVIATIETAPLAADVKKEIEDASGLGMSNVTISEWIECDGVKRPNEVKCIKADAIQYNFMQISVTNTYTPMLNIPGFADFAVSTRNTGSVTVRTK